MMRASSLSLPRKLRRHQWWGLLFVLPVFSLFIIFRFWPMLRVLVLSLESYDLLSPPRFIGFDNYVRLAHDPLFFQSLGATAFYVAGTCVPLWVLSLALALMLNQPIRGIGIFRVAFFLPSIIPAVALPVLWRFLYHPYGLINSILQSVALPPLPWLGNIHTVIPAFILTSEWRFVPLFMIIYLAGLQGVPEEYQEAAKLDGASAVQRFFTITLPLLRPTIVVVVVTSVILTSKSLVLALLMTDGGPDGASRVMSLFVYENGFAFFRLGYAAAASVVLLIVLAFFTVLQLRLLRSAD